MFKLLHNFLKRLVAGKELDELQRHKEWLQYYMSYFITIDKRIFLVLGNLYQHSTNGAPMDTDGLDQCLERHGAKIDIIDDNTMTINDIMYNKIGDHWVKL